VRAGSAVCVSYARIPAAADIGLEAQRQAVAAQVAQAGGELVAEFREVESGKRADGPRLAAALVACRTRHAVLVIAKLDRLARNVEHSDPFLDDGYPDATPPTWPSRPWRSRTCRRASDIPRFPAAPGQHGRAVRRSD
jgi:hypothetical protein